MSLELRITNISDPGESVPSTCKWAYAEPPDVLAVVDPIRNLLPASRRAPSLPEA